MIVVVIIAMVTGGVAVVAVKQAARARLAHAETNAKALRHAIQSFRALEATEECPSLIQLKEQGVVDEASNLQDPWGKDYEVVCEGERVIVTSAGPDGNSGSADDIRVPKAESSTVSL
jgi:type II secretory pathway pseudopilin PulG